jgi:hypothetical protein
LKKIKSFLIFLILWWLIGCNNSKIIEFPTATLTEQIFISTSMPTITPTITFEPTITPTPTLTNVIMADSIPEPIYYSSCIKTEQNICIDKDTPVQYAMAMVIYEEGGSLDPQIAVNALQNFNNMLRQAWNCWNPIANTVCAPTWYFLNSNHIDYENISRNTLEKLLAYVASTPYTTRTITHPNWNGWEMPFPKQRVDNNLYASELFSEIYNMVGKWLDKPSEKITLTFKNYLYAPASALEKNINLSFVYSGVGIGTSGRIADKENTAGYIYRFTTTNGITYNFYYSILP